MSDYKRFEDLELWKAGRSLCNSISKLVKRLPHDEKYRLTDQLVRASRSIMSNIAEGHGRFHFQENIQFCRIARGSLMETWNHLIVAFDEDYICEIELEKYRKDYEYILKLTNGYIAFLKKQKHRTRTRPIT